MGAVIVATVVDQAVTLLVSALLEPMSRKAAVARFQAMIWAGRPPEVSEAIFDVMRELAHDLDYFEQDQKVRKEDGSYFGHKHLEDEIRTSLGKLNALGIAVPSDISVG